MFKLKIPKGPANAYILKNISRSRDDFTVTQFIASGNGGQNRNKTMSAVRIKDKKTGFIVECCEERSRLQNHKLAFQRLCEKLVKHYHEEYIKENEKKYEEAPEIRVYTRKRNEVVDHRTGKSYNLKDTLDGKLDPILVDFIVGRVRRANYE